MSLNLSFERTAYGVRLISRCIQSMRLVFLLFLISIALLAGCSQTEMLDKFVSREEQALGRGYFDQLRARDFEAIERAADSSITGPGLRTALEKMAALLPAQEPRSVKLVGAHRHTQGAVRSLNTTFEYEFPDKWIVANVAIQEKDGAKSIIGFNVYPRSQSLEAENRFTLAGKEPIQYLFLLGAVGALLVSAYALVKCVRTRPLRRKWLWIAFILVGLGKFAVNWTSGEWGIVPASIQLLSAGAVAQLYGPLVVSFSIPVGAIVFLIYARRTKRGSVES